MGKAPTGKRHTPKVQGTAKHPNHKTNAVKPAPSFTKMPRSKPNPSC